MSNIQNNPNYYAIIPASVRYCKDLEPNAKLLYGEITALCNQEGYCWAKNAYFAALYDVDERTIRRWLESLSEKNLIFCDIPKGSFNSQRRIYLRDDFKKSSTVGQKCPDPGQKCPPPPDKNVRHNNTSNNTKEKRRREAPFGASVPAAVSSFFVYLKELYISDEDCNILMEYPEEEVRRAVAFATHPKTKIRTNLIKTIMWAIDKKPPIPEVVDVDKNKKHATNAELILESKSWNISTGSETILIHSKSPYNQTSYTIRYDEEEFMKKLDKVLKACDFKKVKKE